MELSLRAVFLGTPHFAVPTLERMVAAGHQVSCVITQPDRPKGRGQSTAASPVKQAALRLGLEVYQPERIRRPEAMERVAALHPEVMVVVGYGQIIPQAVIDMAPLGILNVHASLLPRYRGAAPIQWAIANGESRTGVTIMKIDAGLDTGDILLMRETEIGPDETAPELSERLAPMGADLLVETLARLREIAPRKQDASQATLAPILKKEDGLIEWNRPAQEIHNRARGFQPWPGAWTRFRGQTLNVLKTRGPENGDRGPGAGGRGLEAGLAPGRVLRRSGKLLAGCGGGTVIELVEVQLEGRKRMSGEAFANGQRLAPDEILG